MESSSNGSLLLVNNKVGGKFRSKVPEAKNGEARQSFLLNPFSGGRYASDIAEIKEFGRTGSSCPRKRDKDSSVVRLRAGQESIKPSGILSMRRMLSGGDALVLLSADCDKWTHKAAARFPPADSPVTHRRFTAKPKVFPVSPLASSV
jgi:hypothetical protein